MKKRLWMLAAVPVALCAGIATAQYPLVDMVANRVIQKYQSSSCEQLWQARGQPKPMEEQNLLSFLQQNPGARQEFINHIAPTVMNKLFECGMIP